MPSGVSEMRPLIAYFTPTDSSPTISGISSSACSICGPKSACVNGNSVGESAASSIDGISSGSCRIERWAYEPISRPTPSWRSYMNTSMSRTIGNSIAFVRRLEARHRADVDHLVDGRRERDVRAGHAREQRAPDAAGDHDGLRLDRPPRGVHAPDPAVLDVHPADVGVGEHLQAAGLDPALAHDRAGAQRVDDGDGRAVEASEQDRLVDVRHELLDLGRGDEARAESTPHDFADAMRRRSSSIRSSVRATSMPPHSVLTPISMYWRCDSSVSWVISFEWSTGKMKLEAWPVEPPGLGSGPLSICTTSVQPSRVRW